MGDCFDGCFSGTIADASAKPYEDPCPNDQIPNGHERFAYTNSVALNDSTEFESEMFNKNSSSSLVSQNSTLETSAEVHAHSGTKTKAANGSIKETEPDYHWKSRSRQPGTEIVFSGVQL